MSKILFLHGLAGCPGGDRVAALRERGHDVYSPTLPFAEGKIAGLVMSFVEQWQRDGGVGNPFPHWTKLAQDAFDEFVPDLMVGFSLGAILAMRLSSGDTPQVLIAPPWSGRVNVASVLEQILPPLPPTMREWLPPLLRYMLAAVTTEPAIKPATLLIHAPADEVVDIEESYRLLRLNPLPSLLERASIASLVHNLGELGHRPLFRRLFTAGHNHACDCAEGLKTLADAADALAIQAPELVLA